MRGLWFVVLGPLLWSCGAAREAPPARAESATPVLVGTVSEAGTPRTPMAPDASSDDERSQVDAIAGDFARPWSGRRGVEYSDQGFNVVLVRAAPASVTAALVARGAQAVPDAIGKSVTIGRAFAFVARFHGHDWTTIFLSDAADGLAPPDDLSRALGTSAFATVSWEEEVEYSYFEQGKLVERLKGTTDAVVDFESHRRSRSDLGKRSGFEAVDAFAKDHGIFVSDLPVEYFFGDGRTMPFPRRGEVLPVGNPGVVLVLASNRQVVSHPEFDKVDYVSWAAP
jgi:hypothetical protein